MKVSGETYYRAYADEIRAKADEMICPNSRDKMYEVAKVYDRLSESARKYELSIKLISTKKEYY